MIPILGRELSGNVRHYEKTKHTNNWHSERMRNTKQRQRTHFKNHREKSQNLKKKKKGGAFQGTRSIGNAN